MGAAGHGQLESWVMPKIRRIVAGVAHRGQGHMLASSIVTRAENQRLNSVTVGCNFFDSHKALDFFDEAFDANALGQPQLAL